MSAEPKSHLFADLNLVLVALIWGVNITVMKMAINEMDPYFFNAVRLPLSALTLGICAWLEQRTRPAVGVDEVSRLTVFQTFLMMAGFSILTGAIYQIAFAMGMARTTAGNTALIMSSVPMWTAIVSVVFVRERLGRLAWIGLTVTFVGTAIVTLQKVGVTVTAGNVVGNFIVLFAALAWAVGSVISRPILKFTSPIKLAFLATLGTLPIHFWAARSSLSSGAIASIESNTWLCIFYSGIFSTGLAYAMWNYGVQQLGASHASVFQNLVPLVALVFSWFLLGEVVTSVQVIGGMMIIAGLVIVRRNRHQPSAKQRASDLVAKAE